MNKCIIIISLCLLLLGFALRLLDKKGLADFLDSQRTARLIKMLCAQAEQLITGDKKGADRLVFVCTKLYNLMPPKWQRLVTPAQLAETVDYIFKEIAIMAEGHRVAPEQGVV